MLILHFAPNSRAGRIVWLLEELQLPYELNRMEFNPKDLKSDAHRARHPLGQAQRLLTKALAPVEEALAGRDYLLGDFSAADIMLGHACYMSNRLGCITDEMSNLKGYVERISERPAFQKAMAA